MKYQPKNLWIFVLVLLVGLLSACASPQPPSSSSGETPSTTGLTEATAGREPVTLTFWHAAPYPPLQPALEEMTREFMEKYPWITVKIEGFAYAEYMQKIDTAVAGNAGPDILWVDSPVMRRYVYYDTILPLTKYLPEKYEDDWFDIQRKDAIFEGDWWGIPLHNSTEALIYNKEIIESAGLTPPSTYSDAWTWDEFREALEKVYKMEADGTTSVYGFVTGGPYGIYNYQPYAYAHGVRFMDDDWTIYDGFVNSPLAVKTMEKYAQFFKDGLAPIERLPDMFQNGKVAFIQNNPYFVRDLEDRFPDFEYGVMPMPCQDECAVISGSWLMGIGADTNHPEEAWLFVDHMTNYEGHKKWIQSTGYAPARKSVYEALPEWKEYPWNIFMEGLMNYPVRRNNNEAFLVFNAEFSNALTDAFVGADIKAGLDNLAKIATEELARFK